MNIKISEEVHSLVSRFGTENAKNVLNNVNFAIKRELSEMIESHLDFISRNDTFDFSCPFQTVIFEIDKPILVKIVRADYNGKTWWLFDDKDEAYGLGEIPTESLLQMLGEIRKQMMQLER